eukprot:scaffold754_cov133-Skeletonema_dohrnii-CCMP3373.AAC.3
MVDGRCCNDGTGAMGWNAAAAVTIVPRWHMPMILDALMIDRECSVVVSIAPLNGATPTYYGTGGPFSAPVFYLEHNATRGTR